jgi:hypothetical protein
MFNANLGEMFVNQGGDQPGDIRGSGIVVPECRWAANVATDDRLDFIGHFLCFVPTAIIGSVRE